MFLLDTNAVSESSLQPANVDPVFKNWIDEIDPNLLYVSVISLMELEVGISPHLPQRYSAGYRASENGLIWKSKPNYEGRGRYHSRYCFIPARV